ncbi:PAS domain-containing hybrid sensor histidine kinase/response regulator [Persicimonas caeni]|uniref:histidine kinase n=1 Tax=Persicimonas caeni TaxID=2292766 RepID=A0A4Y6PQF5_PERCE|nr:ATP-binding protein [Persicimonas caeni]QDG50453.1 PAS domain-containing hybrid sensor histidine kinase/response regulator [Persicimonas caeni]QED31674.1 PAS domain-containing hybrid sensor histidine kinase/response regulator [Persicimonas caeni]
MPTSQRESLDYRHLLEASPEMVCVIATDAPRFTVLAASDAYLEATRTTRDQLIGQGLFEIFDAYEDTHRTAGREQVRRNLAESLETGEMCSTGPLRYDLRRPEDSGESFEERYWTTRSIPIGDDQGGVSHLLHRVEDVTEYIVQERQQDWRNGTDTAHTVVADLRRSLEQKTRRQFHDMFMKAPAFICMVEGPSHTFTMANPAYYELIGHRELIGRTVSEVFPEQEIDKFIAVLDSVYQTGKPRVFYEQEIVLRDEDTGQPGAIHATFAYLPNYNLQGEIEGVAVFGFEVTELVAARQAVEAQAARAERENRHKDEFLAMLGHELRNPLAPIGMALEVMRGGEEGLDEEQLHWGMDLIERQLSQMTRLVDDLLDVARIERAQIDLQLDECTLQSIVSGAVESCRPLINRKEQSLDVLLPDATVNLEVDPVRLTQVVANLLNNASKYTQTGGEITLETHVDAPHLVIEVCDNGQGIDPDLLPHVFTLFKQSETSLDRSLGGLGLGLTLVRRLVEMHGGQVRASSEGTGHGSCFRVEMPVVVDAPIAGDAPTRQSEERGESMRVLVVDDNRDAAEALALLISAHGNNVEVAYDGAEALDVADDFEPQVLFLDIGLPKVDGYQVACNLRNDARFEDATMVAVTGYGQDEDLKRAMEAGFDHHLVKPAARAAIQEVLTSVQNSPARA